MASVLCSPENSDRRSWSVHVADATEPAHTIGIITLLRQSENSNVMRLGQWQLGNLFRRQAWGKGFATESGRAAIESLGSEMADGAARSLRRS